MCPHCRAFWRTLKYWSNVWLSPVMAGLLVWVCFQTSYVSPSTVMVPTCVRGVPSEAVPAGFEAPQSSMM